MNQKKQFVQNTILPVAILLWIAIEGVGCSNTIIDWANVIHFGGITYQSTYNSGGTVTSNDLGSLFARVQTKLSGNINDPHYRLQNGDAAFLDPGTSVYRVRGYQPTFRLAAYDKNHSLLLFEADTNPSAKTGGDLLDISGKVQSLSILNSDEKTTVATTKDLARITRLVGMILAAPVDQSRSFRNEPVYFLSFHLKDGTTVIRAYGTLSHILMRGILLPDAFSHAIDSIRNT